MYAYLLKCENRRTYSCYPSYKNIAGSLNLCQNSVRKYVAGLEDKHLIETEPTTVTLKNGAKRNGNLLYTIRPINEAVDYFNEQQIRNAQFEFAKSELLKRTSFVGDCRNSPENCSFEN